MRLPFVSALKRKIWKAGMKSDDKLSTFGLPYLPDVFMLWICGEDFLHANRIHPTEPTNNYHAKKLLCRSPTVDCKQRTVDVERIFSKKCWPPLGRGGSWTLFHFLGRYFMHANKIQRRKIEFLPCMIAGDWDVLGLQQRKKYISS